MVNDKLLRKLIRSGVEGDVDAFRSAAKEVVADCRWSRKFLFMDDFQLFEPNGHCFNRNTELFRK